MTIPPEYERIPGEIMGPLGPLSEEERVSLILLARADILFGWCSHIFPRFIRSEPDECWGPSTPAIIEIARRFEGVNDDGIHCFSSVVARVLRDFAAETS